MICLLVSRIRLLHMAKASSLPRLCFVEGSRDVTSPHHLPANSPHLSSLHAPLIIHHYHDYPLQATVSIKSILRLHYLSHFSNYKNVTMPSSSSSSRCLVSTSTTQTFFSRVVKVLGTMGVFLLMGIWLLGFGGEGLAWDVGKGGGGLGWGGGGHGGGKGGADGYHDGAGVLEFVNPMIGTYGITPNGNGGMIPSVGMPFGMTRWTAQTREVSVKHRIPLLFSWILADMFW